MVVCPLVQLVRDCERLETTQAIAQNGNFTLVVFSITVTTLNNNDDMRSMPLPLHPEIPATEALTRFSTHQTGTACGLSAETDHSSLGCERM